MQYETEIEELSRPDPEQGTTTKAVGESASASDAEVDGRAGAVDVVSDSGLMSSYCRVDRATSETDETNELHIDSSDENTAVLGQHADQDDMYREAGYSSEKGLLTISDGPPAPIID